jgi:predicted DNA-binding protein with PD1-like motif
MRWKQVEDEPKTCALIFETGDEIASLLQHFAGSQGLAGSSFKAIGALSYAKLGWLNWERSLASQTIRQLGITKIPGWRAVPARRCSE